MRRPARWVHGHIHDSCDHWVGSTSVVRNPYGYDGEKIALIQSALVAMPVSLPASASCLGNAHRDRSKVTCQ
ncbi:MAG: hypothetical protein EOS29_13880 [Mesorhizobium sp.]|nr:MAG: hypothetical protein EOS29_13880 [Mesorhizobium sp.]